ncbi:MAG: hypothetical protein M5U28_05375 [Sandaracinaceae bacterium]|nr:hypothetical protein [Sandaracinaceae bacterium]
MIASAALAASRAWSAPIAWAAGRGRAGGWRGDGERAADAVRALLRERLAAGRAGHGGPDRAGRRVSGRVQRDDGQVRGHAGPVELAHDLVERTRALREIEDQTADLRGARREQAEQLGRLDDPDRQRARRCPRAPSADEDHARLRLGALGLGHTLGGGSLRGLDLARASRQGRSDACQRERPAR